MIRPAYWWAAGALVAAGLLFWGYVLLISHASDTARAEIANIQESVENREYEKAVTQYQDAMNINGAVANDRTAAIRAISDGIYPATGDIQALLANVRELKAAILDPDLGQEAKARAISLLSSRYNESGENPVVFEEVYSGEPFRQFRVGNSPQRSIRKLQEWSFETYPTSRSAMAIASSYVKDLLVRQYLPDERAREINVDEYVKKAEQYLAHADALAAREELKASAVGTQYWRTYTIGGLAHVTHDDAYQRSYRDVYDNFIRSLEKKGDVDSAQYLPFAYWMYANYLVLIDRDADAALTQLNKLVAFVRGDPKFEVNEFVRFVRNEGQGTGGSFNKSSFKRLEKISPEFGLLIRDIQNGS